MSELYDLFHRNFPFCVREESVVRTLLDSADLIAEYRSGHLIGAAALEKNNLLMLCVDRDYRMQGIGSRLLTAAEQNVKDAGFSHITIGAGEHYIMPGVPSPVPVVNEALLPDRIYPGLENHTDFFRKRGYLHAWDCSCFDMRGEFNNLPSVVPRTDGITFRFADADDIPAVCKCVQNAHESFVKYYRNPATYQRPKRRVLIAEQGTEVVGTLMVCLETEGKGLGSVGCTAVHRDWQGRKIATDLVLHGTHALKNSGMDRAFLGYTYTGLDKLYGTAGYQICCYYMMAKKDL